MKAVYQELVERIRGELPDLERVCNRAAHAWFQAKKASGDQDAYLDSVALNLHGFYECRLDAISKKLKEMINPKKTPGRPKGSKNKK